MDTYIFPLPLPAHIVFSIMGLLFFLYMFKNTKHFYHLLLAIAIPSTMLIYFCPINTLSFTFLAIEQFTLLILIIISMVRTKKKEKKKTS